MTQTLKCLTVALIGLSLAGMLVSSLALAAHYNTQPSPCSINDVWDCGIVNHSPYAVLHGVPVAIIGIMGYGLLASLAGRFPGLTATVAFVGLIFALRLTWIEWKVLSVWCVYCVSSQGIIGMIFPLASVAALVSRRQPPERRERPFLEGTA